MRQTGFAAAVVLVLLSSQAKALDHEGAMAETYQRLFGEAPPAGDPAAALETAADRAFPSHNPFLGDGRGLTLDGDLKPGLRGRVVENGPEVALEVALPGVGDRPVEVRAAENVVRLAYWDDVALRGPGTALDGRKRVVHLFPLPAGADAASARLERDGESVRVVFTR
jgi:hypothetical protein